MQRFNPSAVLHADDFLVMQNSDGAEYCLESVSAMTKQQYIDMDATDDNCNAWCDGLTMDDANRKQGCKKGCLHKKDASTYNCKKHYKGHSHYKAKRYGCECARDFYPEDGWLCEITWSS